ncbi:hypothetical protein PJM70_30575, partial [Mycobacterium kansasii]
PPFEPAPPPPHHAPATTTLAPHDALPIAAPYSGWLSTAAARAAAAAQLQKPSDEHTYELHSQTLLALAVEANRNAVV